METRSAVWRKWWAAGGAVSQRVKGGFQRMVGECVCERESCVNDRWSEKRVSRSQPQARPVQRVTRESEGERGVCRGGGG